MGFIKQVLATITGIIVSSVILLFGLVFLIGVIVQQSSDDTVTIAPANSVLYISLDYGVTDKTQSNPLEDISIPFYGAEKSIGLNDILARIEAAKEDDNIKGIYLNVSSANIGFASL